MHIFYFIENKNLPGKERNDLDGSVSNSKVSTRRGLSEVSAYFWAFKT